MYIGIIDEYMYTHEDLVANAGKTRRSRDNNGIDDDGNVVLLMTCIWDFAGNNNCFLTELTMITERMLPEPLAL
jgi:hypothetical protein